MLCECGCSWKEAIKATEQFKQNKTGESKFGGTSGVEFMTQGIIRYKMMGVKNKKAENDFFGNQKEGLEQ